MADLSSLRRLAGFDTSAPIEIRSLANAGNSLGVDVTEISARFARFTPAIDAVFRPLAVVPPSLQAWEDALPHPADAFYERHAEEFNQLFFRKNFLKCLIAIASLDDAAIEGTLVDLGAGAGPMTLAALAWTGPAQAVLIDDSFAQLALAERLFGQTGMSPAPMMFCAEVPEGVRLNREAYIVSSYLLSEMGARAAEMTRLLVGCRSFLIVDTPQAIGQLRDQLPAHAVLRTDTIEFETGEAFAGLIEGGGGRFGYLFGSGDPARR